MNDVWETTRGRRAHLELLHKAAAGDNPVLAEIAKEVLCGRTSLREAAYSSAYSEQYQEWWQPLVDRWQNMSEQERQDAIAHAERYDEESLEHLEARLMRSPNTSPPSPQPRIVDDDEYFSLAQYLSEQKARVE